MGSPPLLKPVLYIKPLDRPPITPMNIDIKNKRYDDEYANVCLTYSYLNHDYTIEEN